MVKFITEDYLKKYTTIYDNVAVKDFSSAIVDAQQIEIQSKIGTKLYDELIAAVESGTLSAAQSALIGKIQPALAHYTCAYAYAQHWAKFTNIGVVTKSGENATSVDIKTLQWLQNSERDKAQFYADRMLDLIKENPTDYPSFYDSTQPIKPDTDANSYNVGWYLGE